MTSFRQPGLACRIFLCLSGILLLAPCGYRLGPYPGDRTLPFETIAVPLFANETQEPRVENLLTEAFRYRLLSAPGLNLRSSGEADALLKGTILSVEIAPVAVNEEFLAMEYRIHLALSISVEGRHDGKVLWSLARVEDEARFYASSDPLLLQDNRSEAFLRLAKTLSERVVDQIMLGF